MKKYYAVRKGLTPGIYDTWDECKAQVDGYSGAQYKSFGSIEEAQAYFEGGATQGKNTLTGAYAFVDGSYNQKTGVYGYGGFVFDGTVRHPVSGCGNDPEMATMRNVAGEIEGSMAAVRAAEALGIKEMTMLYDYMGIEEWAEGRWKTTKKGTQEYRRFMSDPYRTVKVRFEKVKGHTGVEGNELADVMAKNACGVPLTKKQQELLNTL